jgi:hypothetical protein
MELRKHPSMSYRGRCNWPPRWVWVAGKHNDRPTGEVGILKEVNRSPLVSADRIVMVIECKESMYMGYLVFEDFAFARQVYKLLKRLYDCSISDIGSLDVSQLL